MAHFVGLDVSVKETSVCVVDDAGKVILEQKVPTEPADIIALLSSFAVAPGCGRNALTVKALRPIMWQVRAISARTVPGTCRPTSAAGKGFDRAET